MCVCAHVQVTSISSRSAAVFQQIEIHTLKMEELEPKLDWNIDSIFIGTFSIKIILFLLFNLVISVGHAFTPHSDLSQHSLIHLFY